MITSNTPDHLFRFIQLRPATPLAEQPTFELAGTPLAGELAEMPNARRHALAERVRGNDPRLDEPRKHLRFAKTIEEADRTDATVEDFLDELAVLRGDRIALQADFSLLSDALLVRWYASRPDERSSALTRLAKLYAILGSNIEPSETPLAELLEQPLVAHTPSTGALVPQSRPAVVSRERRTQPRSRDPVKLSRAVAELSAMQGRRLIVEPSDPTCDSERAVPFALSSVGAAALSSETSEVLAELRIDPRSQPVADSIYAVEAMAPLVTTVGYYGGVGSAPADADAPPAKATLRPAGVADLLVVKQQIVRYEATEIAHVENVMGGETRSRTHRLLERTEDVFVREEETTREQQNELETAERFELNREISNTVKSDQKFGFDLSLSGKYGPTVEFSSNASLESSTSQEQSVKNSSTFARDVMSRSLEKLTERVREERKRTVIRETEESNLHEFKNAGAEPIVGIYQFLDKVYANRIFNYGKRMMFDFMIPEPASYLWYLEENPSSVSELPEPPAPLSRYLVDASAVSAFTYASVAARYGAAGIEPPPAASRVVSVGHQYGEGSGEGGQPRSTQKLEIDIPAGYRPRTIAGRIQALTDNSVSVYLAVGGADQRILRDEGADAGDDRIVNRSFTFNLAVGGIPLDDQSKLTLTVLAYETNNYAISILVTCDRDQALYQKWQLSTFQAIQTAYLDKVREHEAKVERLRAEQEQAKAGAVAPFGDSPLMNQRTILKELKKHSISIITRQRYEAVGTVQAGDPPWFEFDAAANKGAFIRFFEQAFEWDQLQYVLYPYYWANRPDWAARFGHRDIDPLFQDFLQSGEARVVVPVRPGFERAISYYLETGAIWEGTSEPPTIGSPLYVSIITEIEERTGRSKGEIPVGDSWESRLPTPLVILRRAESLPAWENLDPEGWDWRPLEAEADDD